jgi:hypothetical protein
MVEKMANTADTIRSTQTQDGRILLDIQQGHMYSVNVVGSRILELIDLGWDQQSIAEEISRAYSAEFEAVETDVREFVAALHKHRILRTGCLPPSERP